jgi:prepilin-type processing-associated H-X9-DG protein
MTEQNASLQPSGLQSPPQDGARFDRASIPEVVVVSADRQHLRLGWEDGETLTLTAETMRTFCRCAWCTFARREGTFVAEFAGASISGIDLVGDYAVHIAFADGHAKGVYPWTYLRAIGSEHNEQSNGSSI